MQDDVTRTISLTPPSRENRTTKVVHYDSLEVSTTRLVRMSAGARPLPRRSTKLIKGQERPSAGKQLYRGVQVTVFACACMTGGFGMITPSIQGLYEIESFATSSFQQVIALGVLFAALALFTLKRELRGLAPTAAALLLAFVASIAFNFKSGQDTFFALANWRAMLTRNFGEQPVAPSSPEPEQREHSVEVVDGIRFDELSQVYYVEHETNYLDRMNAPIQSR